MEARPAMGRIKCSRFRKIYTNAWRPQRILTSTASLGGYIYQAQQECAVPSAPMIAIQIIQTSIQGKNRLSSR